MLLILIWVVTVFTLYCVTTAKVYGIQPSISLTAKKLGDDDYAFYLWGVSWLLPLMFLDINGLWFGALSIQAFVFATYSFYKNRIAKVVHNITSIAGPTLSLIAVSIETIGLWYMGVCVLAAFLGFSLPRKNKIWWLEVVVFILVMIPLFTLI